MQTWPYLFQFVDETYGSYSAMNRKIIICKAEVSLLYLTFVVCFSAAGWNYIPVANLNLSETQE